MSRRAQTRPPSPLRRALSLVGLSLLLAALLGFLFLPARCAGRRNAIAFNGVVERKEIVALESRRGSRLNYFLHIRDEGGELIRIAVPREIYDMAVVGTPAHKKTGESWPTLGKQNQQ